MPGEEKPYRVYRGGRVKGKVPAPARRGRPERAKRRERGDGRVDYRGPGIHCCYRRVRVTWMGWNGRRLITMRQTVRKNRRGWPPG